MLTRDTQIIQMGTSEKVGLFIQSISYFVSAFVVGFILSANLTGILLAAIIPAMVIIVVSGTTAVSIWSKRASELTEKAANIAGGAVSAVQVVQAVGANSLLSDTHLRVLSEAASRGFRKSISGAIMLGLVCFTTCAANSLAFYEGTRLENVSAGTIYAVVFLILDAAFVVGQFGSFIQTFAQAASVGGKIIDLLDRADLELSPYVESGRLCTSADLAEGLSLDDVSFKYPTRPTARVLDNVSLAFMSGLITGIVGLSLSGKSTVASLLIRLYDPSAGAIYLGSRDVRDYNVASLRSNIALVDQDPVLFSGTILESISHGIHNADDLPPEEVCARRTQAAEESQCICFH